MNHQPCEDQRDSIHPVALAPQYETPSEIGFSRTKTLLGSLVAGVVVGYTIVNLGIAQNAFQDKPAASPISTIAAQTEGMLAAPVPSALPQPAERRHVEATEYRPHKPKTTTIGREEIVKRPAEKNTTLPKSARVVPGQDTQTRQVMSAHTSKHERRQAAAQFNEFEAMVAIDKAAQQAGVCLGTNDPRPVMRVAVTFATSGRAKKSEVETGPYQNTPQGDCIARVLRSASVKPFDGSAITVHRAVQIR